MIALDSLPTYPPFAYVVTQRVTDFPILALQFDLGTGAVGCQRLDTPRASWYSGVIRGESGGLAVERSPLELALEKNLQLIRSTFEGNVNRLCEVFGVSRQTTHNWISGAKTPREKHYSKISELAKAAEVFRHHGFQVTSTLLDRPLANEKSFLELLASGGGGKDNAEKLIQIAKLDEAALSGLFEAYVPRSLRTK